MARRELTGRTEFFAGSFHGQYPTKSRLIVKRFILVIFHFFAESRKTKNGAALPAARLYASEPGIIPIADARRAGIFMSPNRSPLASSTDAPGEAKRA